MAKETDRLLMNSEIGHRYLLWMKQATMIFLVSDCHFNVSPVNYPDPNMVKLGRVDWVV